MAIGKVFSPKKAVFMRHLTGLASFILTILAGRVLVLSLQPKSGFLPEAGCGRPKLLK
jgi:hypothetical protein